MSSEGRWASATADSILSTLISERSTVAGGEVFFTMLAPVV
ncbi:hypothetical protein ACFFX0_03340 [Citricoccus parietis]|uniref:Uncharacterized protein n=1 Tax=Citricoccus parietis TaxID=592307 RepID=A0ABV5FUB4_9MICC